MLKKNMMVVFGFAICAILIALPIKANAEETSKTGTIYGTVTVDETEVDGSAWHQRDDGSYYIEQVYYVTNASEYVYIELVPTLNVTNVTVTATSTAFSIVSQETDSSGNVWVLAKSNNGSVSSKTEVFTATADIIDPDDLECNLSYQLLNLACTVVEINGTDTYFDDSGSVVSYDEYDEVCNGTTPVITEDEDEANPQTGSVIPYVAIAGGIIAVALVYLIASKSNKVYKI